ncbi:MAG: DUF1232 domain-containing protein [Chloroflexi bacterium]|nr:DUF1232 domain-containing protein [Chloroflexota bacterium]
MRAWRWLKSRARTLKSDTFALYFVARDPRTPWYARAVAGAVVAYALSPFDLIPDFIPVIGYLDDLVVVPLGVGLALRLVPPEVMRDCRAIAEAAAARPISRVGAAFMIAIWLIVAGWLALAIRNFLT